MACGLGQECQAGTPPRRGGSVPAWSPEICQDWDFSGLRRQSTLNSQALAVCTCIRVPQSAPRSTWHRPHFKRQPGENSPGEKTKTSCVLGGRYAPYSPAAWPWPKTGQKMGGVHACPLNSQMTDDVLFGPKKKRFCGSFFHPKKTQKIQQKRKSLQKIYINNKTANF